MAHVNLREDKGNTVDGINPASHSIAQYILYCYISYTVVVYFSMLNHAGFLASIVSPASSKCLESRSRR